MQSGNFSEKDSSGMKAIDKIAIETKRIILLRQNVTLFIISPLKEEEFYMP
jgi:hypothetical protein